ncbi:MAG: hypothetical protein AB7I38_08015 [Dehalococcoidia bacterium]
MLKRWAGRLFYLQLAAFTFVTAVLLFLLGLAALVNLEPFLFIVSWLFAIFVFGISLLIAGQALRQGAQRGEIVHVALPELPQESSTRVQANPTALENRGEIVVERRNQWVGRLGYMDIHVDGIRLAFVGAGETARLIAESGRREVQVRADASSSPPVNLQLHPGEVVRLECGFKGTGWRMLLGPYIALRRHSLYLTLVGDDPVRSET